ncbi:MULTISPECIES: AraC family transcriptional regulator [unclassified Novosphingobium]|uniref:helix-turn-helix domain-containing protein n=1 Tax=unclassified Novosphingobium TaxID=2644732 RepID=UPI00146A0677|nr:MULTISPECIES: AraC family transcriptional regulator [unclassified Novosphingobium]NMN03780.1 AraC-like DNA-binding protein [Novosphingobium sp. SG919]NMN86230.1 AraC-like DNA-binding protein [Novosphingobium sp. SG916]
MPWQTAVLSLLVAQLTILSTALVTSDRNRTANRLLAAWLLVSAGLLMPFALGYAGMFQRHAWLVFLPLAIPLAVGPLAWGYVHSLANGRPPSLFFCHLGLPAAQFMYGTACFLLPIPTKFWWSDNVHEPWVAPFSSVISLVSLAIYTTLAFLALRRYRARLASERSDDERFDGRWLGRALGALGLILALRIIYQGVGAMTGEGSYGVVASFYGMYGAIVLYVAVEGWRHAETPYPRFAPLAATEAPLPERGPDWAEMGRQWTARVREEGWWREPELDLPTMAARLGTNRSHLSRALNDGLGVSFSTFVNGLRAEAVAERLRAGDTSNLLPLALGMGFNSKASFNRAFSARFGVTPTAYRRSLDYPSAPQ